jgi:hypothetical protein
LRVRREENKAAGISDSAEGRREKVGAAAVGGKQRAGGGVGSRPCHVADRWALRSGSTVAVA